MTRTALFVVAAMLMAGLAAAQDPVVRITDVDARKAVVQSANPEYPVMAKQMRVTGKVVVDAHIDPDGKVERVEPVSGNPLLTSAAVAAVKKWKFSPFQSGGKPARAVAALSFEFKM